MKQQKYIGCICLKPYNSLVICNAVTYYYSLPEITNSYFVKCSGNTIFFVRCSEHFVLGCKVLSPPPSPPSPLPTVEQCALGNYYLKVAVTLVCYLHHRDEQASFQPLNLNYLPLSIHFMDH